MASSCTVGQSGDFCLLYTSVKPLSVEVVNAMSEAELQRIAVNEKMFEAICKGNLQHGEQ